MVVTDLEECKRSKTEVESTLRELQSEHERVKERLKAEVEELKTQLGEAAKTQTQTQLDISQRDKELELLRRRSLAGSDAEEQLRTMHARELELQAELRAMKELSERQERARTEAEQVLAPSTACDATAA